MIDDSLAQEYSALAEIRNKLDSLALSKFNLTGARSDDSCMARVDCPANEGHRGGLVIALEPNDLVTLRCDNGCSGQSVADALAITDGLISPEGEVTVFALSAPAPQQVAYCGTPTPHEFFGPTGFFRSLRNRPAVARLSQPVNNTVETV